MHIFGKKESDEAFFTHVRLAVVIGITFALPVTLYQIALFTMPGLTSEEKRYIKFGFPAAFLLFFLGILFAYRVMVPMTYVFFTGFSDGRLVALISVGSYVSFVLGIVIPLGLVFQLPLLVVVLTGIGLLTPDYLKKNRKYSVLVIFILAAVLTPPDVISQTLMAGPLLFLYEISILLSFLVCLRKRRMEAFLDKT
ncbi:MAG: twin-arginine translocase subunit TatC [Clostridiales bacterium]|jgi:sec-independent protein translocase protein TatC|nr:twin-arginine translocase subunit TatC [Clostridiales bacterium]